MGNRFEEIKNKGYYNADMYDYQYLIKKLEDQQEEINRLKIVEQAYEGMKKAL